MSRPILRSLFLVFLLNGCASYPRTGVRAVVGTWANRLGTKLEMRPGGTFDAFVRDPLGGKFHVWGNYTVVGDRITFIGSGGNAPENCAGPGVYRFERVAADALYFKLLGDHCQSRLQNLSLTWRRE